MTSLLIRIALLVLAIWFGVKLLRKVLGATGLSGDAPAPDRFEPTARCRRCGVYLPASAVSSSGQCGKCSG